MKKDREYWINELVKLSVEIDRVMTLHQNIEIEKTKQLQEFARLAQDGEDVTQRVRDFERSTRRGLIVFDASHYLTERRKILKELKKYNLPT
jgi:hypothetical protein